MSRALVPMRAFVHVPVEPRYLMRIEHLIRHGHDERSPSRELWHFAVVAGVRGGEL